MELINIPGIVAERGFITAAQVDLTKDVLVVVKKVSDKRDGSQYQNYPISVTDFLSLTQPAYSTKVAGVGGSLGAATELSLGLNDLTVATNDDSVKLPLNAPAGSSVKVVANKRFSIYSITGALIVAFGNGAQLAPDTDINGAPLNVEYIKHSDGKWYYSTAHTEF